MEKKIITGGGLGMQMLVLGGTAELLSDPDSYERVELEPTIRGGSGRMILNDFTPWHDDHANRKERRRLKPKTKQRFR